MSGRLEVVRLQLVPRVHCAVADEPLLTTQLSVTVALTENGRRASSAPAGAAAATSAKSVIHLAIAGSNAHRGPPR
jgi:hypothetical protein